MAAMLSTSSRKKTLKVRLRAARRAIVMGAEKVRRFRNYNAMEILGARNYGYMGRVTILCESGQE